jgi:hypothetical protein
VEEEKRERKIINEGQGKERMKSGSKKNQAQGKAEGDGHEEIMGN